MPWTEHHVGLILAQPTGVVRASVDMLVHSFLELESKLCAIKGGDTNHTLIIQTESTLPRWQRTRWAHSDFIIRTQLNIEGLPSHGPPHLAQLIVLTKITQSTKI